jgi:phenylalanine-4-hydroxylase
MADDALAGTDHAEALARAHPDATLRGDYAKADAEGVVAQDWGAYTADEHSLWRRLHARQSRLVPRYACAEFVAGVGRLDAADGVPRFDRASAMLRKATGWEIVAVPGLLPDRTFFGHLAKRRFPVTVWLRRPDEFDYIVEPDVFHDFYGHVPLLVDPVFAYYMQAYGEGGLKADRLDALGHLARLYWYTVEFGLMHSPEGLKVYGAGILSSGGEIRYAIEDPRPRRIAFDLLRVMRSDYRIDRMQDTYFVVDDFRQLFEATAPDFTPHYERLRGMTTVAADGGLPEDRLVPPAATSAVGADAT